MVVRIDPQTDALVLVDVQATFFPEHPQLPGSGELPVPGAPAIVLPINGLIGSFNYVVATQDTHPHDHLSFASQYPGRSPFDTLIGADLAELSGATGHPDADFERLGQYLDRVGSQTLWPDHGRLGTPGAEIHPALPRERIDMVVAKGQHRCYDSYSGFFDNGHFTKTALDDTLRVRGFKRLFVAGIALDVCICFTALDALSLGYDVVVLDDCCAALDQPPGAADIAWRRMISRGTVRITSDDIRKDPGAGL